MVICCWLLGSVTVTVFSLSGLFDSTGSVAGLKHIWLGEGAEQNHKFLNIVAFVNLPQRVLGT